MARPLAPTGDPWAVTFRDEPFGPDAGTDTPTRGIGLNGVILGGQVNAEAPRSDLDGIGPVSIFDTPYPSSMKRSLFQMLYGAALLGSPVCGSAQTITYIPPFTDASIAAKSINLSLPVGGIAGSHGVTSTGGASYEIPVFTPPGTNGMAPSLSLTYNSQGADGVLGMGWCIAGLSAIQRVGSDHYHDGKTAPVTYTPVDHFAMDGLRLVPTGWPSLPYGSPDAEYDTERATFQRIKHPAMLPSGEPDYFEALGKDALRRRYGYFNGWGTGKVVNPGHGTDAWLLSNVIDPFGNEIHYEYLMDGEPRLHRVSWCGAVASQSPGVNSIQFNYAERADRNTQFRMGSSYSNKHLLQEIVVIGDGAIVRRYELRYAQIEFGRSVLSEILEYGSDGPALNSTAFKYGDGPLSPEFALGTITEFVDQNVDLISGDFDGNGRSDLIAATFYYHVPCGESETCGVVKVHTRIRVFLNGDYSEFYEHTFNQSDLAQLIHMNGAQGFHCPDVDGDGRDDIVVSFMHWHVPASKYFFTKTEVYRSECDYGSISFTIVDAGRPDYTVPHGNAYSWLYPKKATRPFILTGDFTGDGRADILTILYSSSWSALDPPTPSDMKVFLWEFANPNAWTQQSLDAPSAQHLVLCKHVAPISSNGDNRMDLIARYESVQNGCRVLSRGANGVWSTIVLSSDPPYYPDPNGDLLEFEMALGDLNADGYHDILQRQGPYLVLWYGTGIGWSQQYIIASDYEAGDSKVILADLNGDGRTDILHSNWNSTAGYTNLRVYYSKGLDTNGPVFQIENIPYANLVLANAVGDFNADGRADILNRHYFGAPVDILSFRPFGKDRCLDKVVDGLLNPIDFDYGFASDPTLYNDEVQRFEYPDGDFDMPFCLVSEVRSMDPVNGITWSDFYGYKDGVGFRSGPGFVGFSTLSTLSTRTDRFSETEFTFNGAVTSLFPASQKVSDASTGFLLTESHSQGGALELNPGMHRFVDQLLSETSTDWLSGVSTSRSNMYTAAGDNIFSTTTTIPGVGTTVEHFSYSGYGPGWPFVYHNRMTSHQITRTRAGEQPIVELTTYEYDLASAALRKRTEFANTSSPLVYEIVDRYSEGTVRRESLSYSAPFGTGERITEYSYDALGRFPQTIAREVTLAQGNWYAQSSFEYDPGTGLKIHELGPDGLKSINRYDGHGRPYATSAPHLVGEERYDVESRIEWAIDEVTGSSYKISSVHSGKPTAVTYCDRLGRELEHWTESLDGAWSKVFKGYDPQGRNHRTSDPALDSEPHYYTETGYDELGRPVSAVHDLLGGQYTSYTYQGGLLVTTSSSDASNHVRKTWTDAQGIVVKAEDGGGLLNYEHDSRGQVTRVALGPFTQVSIKYDELGFRKSMTDQSAGVTQYRYDPFGQLIWERNAKGNEKAFEYDQLGRLLSTTEDEGVIEYRYFFEDGRISNRLSSVTGFGSTREFKYDPLLRLTSSSLLTPLGDCTTKSYAYDDFDRLSHTYYDYPLSILVKREYSSTGHLETVSNLFSGDIYFTAFAMDGQGRYAKYATLDGVVHNMEYAGPYLNRQWAEDVQDLGMEWEASTGNLQSRYDAMKKRLESFEYDILDRLTKATVEETDASGQPVAQLSITKYGYDLNGMGQSRGNLVRKNDTGIMGYMQNAVATVVHNEFPVPPDAPPTGISLESQAIKYTSYNQPTTLAEAFNGNPMQLEYYYGPEHQRVASSYGPVNEEPEYTRLYDGDTERRVDWSTGVQHDILYISGGAGLCAMVVVRNGGEQVQHFAAYTDHLGSIVALTEKVGNEVVVVAEQNFDPWGRPRNPETWLCENVPTPPEWLYRGYTGHEHVEPFALINMNGRMYDPVNGRMLSADNYVQGSVSTQAYNRYSYARNNPLKYTDPDGEFVVSMLLGASIGVAINAIGNVSQGKPLMRGAFGAAILGGLTGAVSFGIGQGVSGITNSFAQAGIQTAAHGHFSGILSSVTGGSYGAGFASGSLASVASIGGGALSKNWGTLGRYGMTVSSGAIAGAGGAAIGGGNVSRGASYGAIAATLNHSAHSGALGQNIAASLITQRLRHVFGPDATALALAVDGYIIGGMGGEVGILCIHRGSVDIVPIMDGGFGWGLSAGFSIETTSLYYSGSVGEISQEAFLGSRGELVISGSVAGFTVGAVGIYAPSINGNFVVGAGRVIGIDAIPLPIKVGGSFNLGGTTELDLVWFLKSLVKRP